MPEIDGELLARALTWCAESGRPTAEERLRAVLQPLSWDELLAVKGVLADPPPAGDLGPEELLALARGAEPSTGSAAARPAPPGAPSPRTGPEAAAAPSPARRGRSRRGAPRPPAAPRIRRMRDRTPEVAAAPAALPLLDEAFREEGRTVLERLVRRLGASRPVLVRALAQGWRRADGSPPGPEDVERLVVHHGLARAFEERERALLLHTIRKHGGVRPRAAAELGHDLAGIDAAVERLGLRDAVDAVRSHARRERRRRATLAERARQVSSEADALSDLGLLEEVDEDLRRRLPEHVRALRASAPHLPLAVALERSLSLEPPEVLALMARLAIDLPAPSRSAPGHPATPVDASRPGRPVERQRRPARSGSRPQRPGGRPPARRDEASRAGGDRPSRAGSQPGGSRSRSPPIGQRPPRARTPRGRGSPPRDPGGGAGRAPRPRTPGRRPL